ncbi:MAG: fumarate reductase/succinate dehydrogenase flavoprotein subunit, partial [Planctomycetota bacterium]|nr:fumarate reductase/succinate dehydrogenase flavoprotein subunit [Planctomycetota bacterium]
MVELNSKIPDGPIEDKWHSHLEHARLVGPRNRPTYDVIVVGTGLAGASAASSLAAQGYNVHVFIYHDTPRRAHSIAAQGGINACKNYREDGDSTYRLFYDTQKGGDFRSREANVYRLAQTSTQIIDQCVAQGVPFAREYGGMLANRSFGGVLVERTFYCRGQTGQQLLLGAYQALQKEIELGKVKMHTRSEMLDLVMVDGRARGIVYRDMVDGSIKSIAGEAVVLATGGYGAVYFNSTNAINSNGTAIWRAHKRGAAFANPSFVQIHPTCIPVSGDHQSKLTLMSESLRNDGRVWVPRTPKDTRNPADIPEEERYYYLEERYPTFGNLVPRDVASRAAKVVCDDGLGVGSTGYSVYMDFRDAIESKGRDTIAEKYGNLFDMYSEITGESPYDQPFRIYPAVHYCMGGLWVDYNLQTTIPGLYAIGEANFSDHGANRLGASSLMQCLADGYFILPQTIGDGLQPLYRDKVDTTHPAFARTEAEVRDRIQRVMSIKGDSTPLSIHKRLGKVIWNNCGMSRNAEDLASALDQVDQLKKEFWENVNIPGTDGDVNQTLERALRLVDFLEIGEL